MNEYCAGVQGAGWAMDEVDDMDDMDKGIFRRALRYGGQAGVRSHAVECPWSTKSTGFALGIGPAQNVPPGGSHSVGLE